MTVWNVAVGHYRYDTFFSHVMELNDRLEGLPFGEVRPACRAVDGWLAQIKAPRRRLQEVLSLAKEVIQTDLPRWVEAKARRADFAGDLSRSHHLLLCTRAPR